MNLRELWKNFAGTKRTKPGITDRKCSKVYGHKCPLIFGQIVYCVRNVFVFVGLLIGNVMFFSPSGFPGGGQLQGGGA